MTASADTEVTRALVLTRLFIEAIDARDLDALSMLTAENVEFRNPAGRSFYGREGLGRIVDAAGRARLWLVRRGKETVSCADDGVRISVPVIEFVSGAEIDGTANFEVRDSEVTALEVSSELLRASTR